MQLILHIVLKKILIAGHPATHAVDYLCLHYLKSRFTERLFCASYYIYFAQHSFPSKAASCT